MIKKLFLIATLCFSSVSLMAQDAPYPYKWGAGAEYGYGSALNPYTVRGQYYFNKYLTWDFLQYRMGIDFNNAYDSRDYSMTNALTTGLRVYTPTFGPGMKAFAAAGAGWGHYFTWDKAEHFLGKVDHCSKTHNFAADFSAGLFVWHGIYLSYSYQLLHNNSRGNYGNHFFNLGVEFGSMPAKWFKTK